MKMLKKEDNNPLPKALRHLSQSDPIMASLIAKHGECPIFSRAVDPFATLVRSIISQQLSAKAADTIEGRVVNLVGELIPARLLATPASELQKAGLSGAKVRYIKEIAGRVVGGRLVFADLVGCSDEEVLTILTAVPGIGRWTAEMFLIFGLGRPDVLAGGDAGLKRAVRQLYGESKSLLEAGEHWRPYRSVAAWYLWKHLDG